MTKPNIYQAPWYVPARPWHDIENHFQTNFGGARPQMLQLVRHIIEQGYSNRLFAYTSMDKIIISIYDQIDPLNEAFHVEFDLFNTQQWIFRYFVLGRTQPEFYRSYLAHQGLEKFDSFINEKIRW